MSKHMEMEVKKCEALATGNKLEHSDQKMRKK